MASDAVYSSITLAHDTALLASPDLHARPVALLAANEVLALLDTASGFVHVRQHNGRSGFVPAALCRGVPASLQAAPVDLHPSQVVQAVNRYDQPHPGGQSVPLAVVLPEDHLLALGITNRFLLVQFQNGSLGYVPAALCQRVPDSDQLMRLGPIDLGWLALGSAWGIINTAALLGGLDALLLDRDLLSRTTIAGLGLLLVGTIASVLWAGSRRRRASRSMAIGLLLAYGGLHLLSLGRITLWVPW